MRSAGASGTTIARAAGKENRQARASTKWLAAGFFFIFGLHVDSGLILGHRLLFLADTRVLYSNKSLLQYSCQGCCLSLSTGFPAYPCNTDFVRQGCAPPITCIWRWYTSWPPSGPVLKSVLKPPTLLPLASSW